jgi:hypothetical protein
LNEYTLKDVLITEGQLVQINHSINEEKERYLMYERNACDKGINPKNKTAFITYVDFKVAISFCDNPSAFMRLLT